MPNELLGVRVHPWQAFRLRKYAEMTGRNAGEIVGEALQLFFSYQQLNSETQQWLKEYRDQAAPDDALV